MSRFVGWVENPALLRSLTMLGFRYTPTQPTESGGAAHVTRRLG